MIIIPLLMHTQRNRRELCRGLVLEGAITGETVLNMMGLLLFLVVPVSVTHMNELYPSRYNFRDERCPQF